MAIRDPNLEPFFHRAQILSDELTAYDLEQMHVPKERIPGIQREFTKLNEDLLAIPPFRVTKEIIEIQNRLFNEYAKFEQRVQLESDSLSRPERQIVVLDHRKETSFFEELLDSICKVALEILAWCVSWFSRDMAHQIAPTYI